MHPADLLGQLRIQPRRDRVPGSADLLTATPLAVTIPCVTSPPRAPKVPIILNSLPVCVNPSRGMNCFWEMPFRKHCKITMENRDPKEKLVLYYQINYTLTDVPDDAAYFHAQWRRANPLPYGQVYTILDGVKGKGHYVGTVMGWGINNNRWWGEGEASTVSACTWAISGSCRTPRRGRSARRTLRARRARARWLRRRPTVRPANWGAAGSAARGSPSSPAGP